MFFGQTTASGPKVIHPCISPLGVKDTLKIPVVLFRRNAFHFVLSCPVGGRSRYPDTMTQAAADPGQEEKNKTKGVHACSLCSRQDKSILRQTRRLSLNHLPGSGDRVQPTHLTGIRLLPLVCCRHTCPLSSSSSNFHPLLISSPLLNQNSFLWK